MTDATQVTNIDSLPNLLNEPGASMRRFWGTGVMLQEARTPKGNSFEPHQHHNEQLVLVLEGRIRLDIFDQPGGGSRSVELGEGDMIVLPPNVPHGGETLEDCRVLDAFTPPRTTVLGEPEGT